LHAVCIRQGCIRTDNLQNLYNDISKDLSVQISDGRKIVLLSKQDAYTFLLRKVKNFYQQFFSAWFTKDLKNWFVKLLDLSKKDFESINLPITTFVEKLSSNVSDIFIYANYNSYKPNIIIDNQFYNISQSNDVIYIILAIESLKKNLLQESSMFGENYCDCFDFCRNKKKYCNKRPFKIIGSQDSYGCYFALICQMVGICRFFKYKK